MESLIQHYQENRILLLLIYNENTHRIICKSTNFNDRERDLLKYLAGTELKILNRGDISTFQIKNRIKVHDLTLGSEKLRSIIVGRFFIAFRSIR